MMVARAVGDLSRVYTLSEARPILYQVNHVLVHMKANVLQAPIQWNTLSKICLRQNFTIHKMKDLA